MATTKSEPAVLKTRAEVANYFGVSERTVTYWQSVAGFPGRSGSPSTGEPGHYPLQEIAEWRKNRISKQAQPDEGSVNAKIQAERLRKLRIENDEAEGRLIDCLVVARIISRMFATAKQYLLQVPHKVQALLPGDLPQHVRDEIQKESLATINRTFANIASEIRDMELPKEAEA